MSQPGCSQAPGVQVVVPSVKNFVTIGVTFSLCLCLQFCKVGIIRVPFFFSLKIILERNYFQMFRKFSIVKMSLINLGLGSMNCSFPKGPRGWKQHETNLASHQNELDSVLIHSYCRRKMILPCRAWGRLDHLSRPLLISILTLFWKILCGGMKIMTATWFLSPVWLSCCHGLSQLQPVSVAWQSTLLGTQVYR